MDLNNGAKLLYSNFGNLQKSNSEKLPEVSDYFDSNPATPVKDIPATPVNDIPTTPVKDIGAPIKDTQIVTVAMNLSDILETIDVDCLTSWLSSPLVIASMASVLHMVSR